MGGVNKKIKEIGLPGPWWDPAGILQKPKVPDVPNLPPPAPSPADPSLEAIRNAKLMERRRQMGLSSDATWLTGARGDTTGPNVAVHTLLGE